MLRLRRASVRRQGRTSAQIGRGSLFCKGCHRIAKRQHLLPAVNTELPDRDRALLRLAFADDEEVRRLGQRMLADLVVDLLVALVGRSEEHTSELQSLMRISYAVFCLKKKLNKNTTEHNAHTNLT